MYDSPLLRRPFDPPGRSFGLNLGLTPPFGGGYLGRHDFSRISIGGEGGLHYRLNPALFPLLYGLPFAATPSAATLSAPTPSEDHTPPDLDFPKVEPDLPQMAMPVLGITNAAWMAQNPLYTLTTEFTGLAPLMSETTPGEGRTLRPSFQVAVRDRLWRTGEFGVFGGFGGKIPLRSGMPTGTGLFGFSLHLGPEQPTGEEVKYGTGAWLSLYQAWGAEPDNPHPPPGWSFNPSFNLLMSHSWLHPDVWGFDLVWGAGISRWGAVNDVNASTVLSPFIGLNYARNVSKHDTLNWEATIGPNIGLGGRYGALAGSPTPVSVGLNVGLFGWQHTWGDYGFGLEPWFFAEPWSNVANPGASFWNMGGGLRLDFGAINPRREHVDDEWPR